MADGDLKIAAVRVMAPLVEDIAYLSRRMRADEIEQWLALTGFAEYDPNEAARSILATMGEVAFCLIDREDKPIVAGGYTRVRPGVWQSWMVGTDASWEKHWRSITKVSRQTMDTLLASPECHRVQTMALESRTAAHRWYVEGLGMVDEGIKRAVFANGADGREFSKVREGR